MDVGRWAEFSLYAIISIVDSKSWAEVTITVPESVVDAVSDFLAALSGRGITLNEQPGGTRVTGYLDPGAEDWGIRLQRYLDSLTDMDVLPGQVRPEIHMIPEEDWMAVFRSQHSTVRISGRLIIRPTWCRQERDKEIVLDPELAFGTGSHATTRMCLALLDGLPTELLKERVLDLGTGTGILAIAAAFLGASEVWAVDNDPIAVQVAGRNVESNGVGKIVSVMEGSIDDLEGPFHIVLANLSASLLVKLAVPICDALDPVGTLIISGVMTGEREVVLKCFSDHGLNSADVLTEDVWVAAALSRRGRDRTLG